MKLFTHNMLTSKCLKGVQVGYPLKLVANEVKETKVDFKPEFIQRIIPKIEWIVLKDVAKQLGVDLPVDAPDSSQQPPSEEILRKVHHALLEIEVIQGELVCPETDRKFPIKDGIPNMLCNEDEV